MSTHGYVCFLIFFPVGVFNGNIKNISMLIVFSYFSHCVFRSFAQHIIYKSSDFFNRFFEDHTIPLIFPTWFFEEFDIVTYKSNVQGGVL
jgi:hypothetical protein